MSEKVSPAIDITMLVCTYNRAADLRELLESALAQETAGEFTYEVLVVDNNSVDDTRRVVESLIAQGHDNLRYVFEPRQGKSFALNTGLKAARGALYTITDDDFILPHGWLKSIVAAFGEHPEAAFVSGKVLPLWKSAPPAWLTAKHWSAIAMADYGEAEFYVDESNPICLLACAFRRANVLEIGGYDESLGVSGSRIGGTEDSDILVRLWQAGRKGLYLPRVALYHKVEPNRLTKAYHRRWHTGHGRQYAVMRDAETEQAAARLFDVPSHLYRQAAADGFAWLKLMLTGNAVEAFWHEKRLRFFAGFFTQRRQDYLAAQHRRGGTIREVATFVRSLIAGKARRPSPKEIG